MLQTVNDARRMLAPVFDQYGVSKAVLFGSIVKGTATAKSDLDLLVKNSASSKRCGRLPECPWTCSMSPTSSAAP